ncbi:MAG: ROK family protein [Planctomycetaceae bacterium]|nr:ROK family protein [Planctomycetaceae bacterium]
MNILAIDIGGSQFRTAVATVSDATVSDATVSDATVSDATVSDATVSDATVSDATVSDAAVTGADVQFVPAPKRTLAPDCTKEQLFAMLDESIAESAPEGNYERIGITIPGLADPVNGIWVYACFSGIRDVPIAKILSEKYGKPVFIDNDVNACALAERRFGICKETNDFLWITVSNGIGGGLVLGGKVYAGHFGNAGEVGHFCVVEKNGFRCGCGNDGCLEAEAAGPGIARRYAALLGKEPPDFSAEKIAELARAGNETALSVFGTTGRLIGKAASYAVNLLNLEKVVIGGGVSNSFDLLLPSMEASFREKLFRDANPRAVFEKTALGTNAGLAGAVAVALR